MGHNTSELDSASLRYVGVTKLPEMLKSVTGGEAILKCNRWAPRGGWRWHVEKERSRNLRGPERVDTFYRESDGFIVVKKGLTTWSEGSRL